ncbi:MAG: glycine--tRNA ligase subunit beta [Pseudomonadota bacterium]
MPDLLIELLSEEIPARMQSKAADDLRRLVLNGFAEAGLSHGDATCHATPRRLVLSVADVAAESPMRRDERKGPKVDAPEKALEGFLRGAGLTKGDLEQRETPKGPVWFATIETPGRAAAEIIGETLEKTVRGFPWPKSMRWGSGSLRWVRPLQGILCILSDGAAVEVVALDVDGIVSGDSTVGHRFMAPVRFTVTGFADYEAKLSAANVVLRAEKRADEIWAGVTAAAEAKGLAAIEDKGLLAEVAGLVEWPVVLIGEIGADYLDLPAEVLRTSMKEHQKFFSVANKDGKITHFATIANIEAADRGEAILRGNQKVLSARLADAKFFWENDLREAKAGMGAWTDALSSVTFHAKLGTQAARIDRIASLARELAPAVGADPDIAEQAARIAKADLSSEMVYEFPELQGVMGAYYAEAADHSQDVAAVAREHYQPLGPSDGVPSAPLSVTVAMADKLDMLTGFWAIDEKPTGSKDPFALRRAALGVIRLVLENGVRVPLLGYISTANEIAGPRDGSFADVEDLLSFFHDRLKVYFRDKGVRHDVIDAVLAMPGADDLVLVEARAMALNAFLGSDDGENLLQGFKRANNILSQAEEADGVEYSYGADLKFAETDEERALFAALDSARAKIAAALEAENFEVAMGAMAELRAPIDAFFEAVQVNADSSVLRRNRLNLLSDIRKICFSVADLSRIEG